MPRPAADLIRLRNLTFDGRHGALRFERETGVRFRVDLDLELDLQAACETDDLASTVDYRDVAARVLDVGTGRSFQLVERLADEIARDVLLRFPRVEAVTVQVRKLVPVLAGHPEAVGVRLRRTRG